MSTATCCFGVFAVFETTPTDKNGLEGLVLHILAVETIPVSLESANILVSEKANLAGI